MTPKEQGKAAEERRAAATKRRHRLAGIVLAVVLVALFAIVAAAEGLGSPSVPDDAIAVVEDVPGCAEEEGDDTCVITKEQFDHSIQQTAAGQGIKQVPASDDPQYAALRDTAVGDLLLAAWVRGEAADRGIEVSDREIDQQLEQVKKQQFGSEAAFQRFLKQLGFTLDEARDRIELQLISDRVQQEVLPDEPPVNGDEIQAYYDENSDQFKQPESRDVRVVLTKEESDAQKAASELQADPSSGNFNKVAKELSIDEATKSSGGLRQGVVQGQGDPALDQQIFSAPLNEVVGPFQTDAGFYVIRVEKITPGQTTSLSDASDQIRQTLVSARQQQIAQDFQADFLATWSNRTFCADDYRIDRCSNAEAAPSACTKDVAEQQGCDAPVPSIKPIQPGTAGVFGAPAPTGLPQGPITPASQQPPGGLPPGLTPLPGGAQPGATPGAAPAPQTAPPGG